MSKYACDLIVIRILFVLMSPFGNGSVLYKTLFYSPSNRYTSFIQIYVIDTLFTEY